MDHIGKRIKEKRELLGMTQEDLANRLGYKNKSTIAKIENGTNDIVQSKVVEFANVLNTDVAFLMGWAEEIKEKPVEVANELADIYFDNDLRKMIGEYRLLDESHQKQVREYVSFLLSITNDQ